MVNAGAGILAGATPVPVNETLSVGVPAAAWKITPRLPALDGMKVIKAVQLLAAVIVAPLVQVPPVTVKSPELLPVMV